MAHAVLWWGEVPVRMAAAEPFRVAVDAAAPMRDAAQMDLEAVRRCLDDEPDAFAELVERYQQRVATMMWRFTRDPVEHRDLVQEVFVQSYRSLHRFRARAPFVHWLSRIATHTGYTYWKKRAREAGQVPLEEWDGWEAWDPASLDAAGAAARLHALLAALPPRDRLVLTLRYLEELDVAATAARTGWSRSMVKLQTHRAKRKLKTLVERANRETG